MLDDIPDLKVPKRVVSVELVHALQPPLLAQLFVAEHETGAVRDQGILDLLEQEGDFLPARDELAGVLMLVQKRSLVRVSLSATSQDGGADEGLYATRRTVRVLFSSGPALTGDLLYTLPARSSRVADYLNLPARFFSVWAADRLHLVNKSLVERVIEEPLDLVAPAEE